MNLPNKLTVMRICLIPFVMFFYLANFIPYGIGKIVALAIFIVAALTDLLDGKIARKHNLVTNLGKFLDPIADKILTSTVLFMLIADGTIPAPWGVIVVSIIIAREFMVSGLRLVTAGEGVVVAAGIWGKLKTAFTMVAIVVILIFAVLFGKDSTAYDSWVIITEQALIWISTLLTVISGAIYLNGYKDYINTDK